MELKNQVKDIPTGIVSITPKYKFSVIYICESWKYQNGCCAYSEIPMGCFVNRAWIMSIKKINGGFYIHGNMALICIEFNSTEYQTDWILDL